MPFAFLTARSHPHRLPRVFSAAASGRALPANREGSRGLKTEIYGGGGACVVTGPWVLSPPPKAALRALINPANRLLVGTALPYFPRGGPLPASPPPGLAVSSGWGGMDAGWSMLYPAQAVDGVTHLHAGTKLRAALTALKINARGERCAIGCAVLSPSFQLKHFDAIAHTPTPFWPSSSNSSSADSWRQQLIDCYISSALAIIFNASPGSVHSSCTKALPTSFRPPADICIATPLLGSGAAGAPFDAAAQCAAEAVLRLRALDFSARVVLRFVLNDEGACTAMSDALSNQDHTVVS